VNKNQNRSNLNVNKNQNRPNFNRQMNQNRSNLNVNKNQNRPMYANRFKRFGKTVWNSMLPRPGQAGPHTGFGRYVNAGKYIYNFLQ
jgi:hypothetical protein